MAASRFALHPPRRLVALAGVAAVLLAFAGTALATGAIKGTTYSGRLKPAAGIPLIDGTPITLVVSASGKKVTVKMESFPLFCEGGGPPQVIRFKPAQIKNGRFQTTGTETTEKQFGGELTSTAVVTGKFLAGGKARGSFEDKFTKAPSCGGKTTYHAAATPG